MPQSAHRLITEEGAGTPGAKQTHMYAQTHSWTCRASCSVHTSPNCQREQNPEVTHLSLRLQLTAALTVD